MRILTLTAFVTTMAAMPSSAQGSRVSFEAGAGLSINSPIFDHTVVWLPGSFVLPGTSGTRLSVGNESLISGRIGYRLAGPLAVFAEIGEGPSAFQYTESANGNTWYSQWGQARRRVFALGASVRSQVGALPLFVEPQLGFAMQRLKVGNQAPSGCLAPPPSLTGVVACPYSERWERTYTVPGVNAGLSLGYAIAPRAALELRGQYSVGRTSTEEAFYVKLIPALEYAEAPKSQTVRSSYVSLGVRVTP